MSSVCNSSGFEAKNENPSALFFEPTGFPFFCSSEALELNVVVHAGSVAAGFLSGLSITKVPVVSASDVKEAAFCRAKRVTFTGSLLHADHETSTGGVVGA